MSGIEGSSTTWIAPSGAPASTAASARVRAASAHTPFGHRVGAHYGDAPRHEAEQRLEVHRRHRVRRRSQRQHDAGRPWDREDLRCRVEAGRDVVVVPVGLDDAGAAGDVLDRLVLDNAITGLAHRHLGVLARLGRAGVRRRRHDPVDAVLVVAGERERGPLRPLEHRPCPGHAGRLGEQVDFDLCHAEGLPLRRTSFQALPIATSVRPRSSSDSSGVMRMPGLNCSTLGSRVEKIAQTPVS